MWNLLQLQIIMVGREIKNQSELTSIFLCFNSLYYYIYIYRCVTTSTGEEGGAHLYILNEGGGIKFVCKH